MNKNILYRALLTFVLSNFAAYTFAYSFDGPLQTRNQFPVFLHLNQPLMEKANIEDFLSFSISTSTTHQVHNSENWSMGVDLEMTELDIRARKIIFNSVEIGADIPYISYNSGFLDAPLNFYHRAFGFRDYGRSSRPENDFLYDVKRKGVTIVKGEVGSYGISDIRLSAKKLLVASDRLVGFKMSLDIPTGDAKKGYGSGNFGADGTILLDQKLGERFMTYTNIGVAFPGDLAGYETVKMRSFFFGGVALEMAARKDLSLLAQLSFQESPYPETGISEIDGTATLFSVGARYVDQNGAGYEFNFTEDPNATGAPDFSVGLSYKIRYD